VLAIACGNASGTRYPVLLGSSQRLSQLTGDVDVARRVGWVPYGTAPDGTPLGTPWNPNQIEGYYALAGGAATPPGAANATAGLTTWFYEVDGADAHYPFEGMVWSDGTPSSAPPPSGCSAT
jgi:hypothetical protein